MKDEGEHTDWKPELGARKPNAWVSTEMPSENSETRKVTELSDKENMRELDIFTMLFT